VKKRGIKHDEPFHLTSLTSGFILNKTVFFDLGNVILFFSHDKMCEQLAKVAGKEVHAIKHLLFQTPLVDSYEKGNIDTQVLFQFFSQTFGCNVRYEDFLEALCDIFVLNHPMIPLLSQLKQQGNELILLSNTCPAHFEFATHKYPELKIFDQLVLSYELGYRKPDPNIYQYALKKSSFEINDCFYTDDIKEYVEKASSLGINSHLFTSCETLTQELISKGFLHNERKNELEKN